jgi:dTDP-D-glucose 4,6-dehydratase
MYFDIAKARTKLGWEPRYSNEEMFVESYRWYVENRQSILSGSKSGSHHQSAVKQGALAVLRWLL